MSCHKRTIISESETNITFFHRYQHKKFKCTGFYLSQSRMKGCDFRSKTPFEFCIYFQYEQNYAQFTVSLIQDFLYYNYSKTMGVNKELIL